MECRSFSGVIHKEEPDKMLMVMLPVRPRSAHLIATTGEEYEYLTVVRLII